MVIGDNRYRTLRGNKNRFGAVNELGVFAMTGQGMREVKNPSAIFLSRGKEDSARLYCDGAVGGNPTFASGNSRLSGLFAAK